MTYEIAHAVLLTARDIVIIVSGVFFTLGRYETWRERRSKRKLEAASVTADPPVKKKIYP